MDTIIPIEGNVKFKITLDPGVWIFDDQKLDLLTYFDTPAEEKSEESELREYTQKASHYWDREIQEGAVFPKTLKTERKFEKVKLITGTFGISLKRFLQNAEPASDAKKLIIETADDQIQIPLDEGYNAILGFSKNGKPLTEDGPVHFYLGNGSNKENPIKNVKRFIVE